MTAETTGRPVVPLRLVSVSKRFVGGRWALREVQAEIRPGEVVAFSGSNGSGKTTLLRILAGLSQPTAGRITGRPSRVGYVPDRFVPDARMSARSYLHHMGRLQGLPTRTAAARAERLLDRLVLPDGSEAPMGILSKGNAQKVAVAQALLAKPGLLVLDEPWSGLDASAHGVLAELMTEVADAGGAVVFTDHREAITRAYATRTYLVAGGRVTPYHPESHGRLPRPTDHPPTDEPSAYGRTGPAQDAADPHTAEPHTAVPGIQSGAHTTITLTMPGQGPGPRPLDWYALPGVRAATAQRRTSSDEDPPRSPGGPLLELTVDRAATDTVLLTVLQHGWSVVTVSRGPGAASDTERPSGTGTSGSAAPDAGAPDAGASDAEAVGDGSAANSPATADHSGTEEAENTDEGNAFQKEAGTGKGPEDGPDRDRPRHRAGDEPEDGSDDASHEWPGRGPGSTGDAPGRGRATDEDTDEEGGPR